MYQLSKVTAGKVNKKHSYH